MTVDPMSYPGFAGPPRALAADADRERAVDVLRAGFAEGRLTKGEHDDRVSRAYAARTYGELGLLVADLPAGPFGGLAQYPGGPPPGTPGGLQPRGPGGPYPVPAAETRVSGLAVAALAFGIAEFFTMGAAAIPALVLGHAARRSIRRTGERGDAMALTGIVLGWAGLAVVIFLVVTLITISDAARHAVVINPATGLPAGLPAGFPGRPGAP
jgi:Domain of unknown function (DUF1707)/Domain of unknown function (DUF4190)